MTFTASNTVGQMILDGAAKLGSTSASMVRKDVLPYGESHSATNCAQRAESMPPTIRFCVSLLVPESCTGNVQQGIENDAQQHCHRESTR
jgi:hypothetical protein